jgi:hypothetical protein
MRRPDKKTSLRPPPIKINSQELEHIIQACEKLEELAELAQYAALYKNLGWSLVALDSQVGTGLGVDFDQPEATWSNLLLKLALKKATVSLALRLEPHSRLFVIKVDSEFGTEFLNSLGDWRSPCIARAGNRWENHFLVLPQPWCLSPQHSDEGEDASLSVIGPGSLVPVPPSADPASRETWHWLHPPWEHHPWYPFPGLLRLLEEVGYISRRNLLPEEDFPTWEDLYPVICDSPELLQAIMTPVATKELYYRTILYEAIRAGFRDPRMLQGLLWHAPHGETRHGLEARQQLSQWAMEIQWLLSAEVLKPLSEAKSPPTGSSRKELNLLAALASELEQQVDELERQQLSSEVEPGRSSSPLQPEKNVTPNLTGQKNWEELEELRGALEDLLSKYKDLSDSK